MNSNDVIKLLKNDGWQEKKRGGTSHIQFVHPDKKGKVTVASHGEKRNSTQNIKINFKTGGAYIKKAPPVYSIN